MKCIEKEIKDLSKEEINSICNIYPFKLCCKCPLYLEHNNQCKCDYPEVYGSEKVVVFNEKE